MHILCVCYAYLMHILCILKPIISETSSFEVIWHGIYWASWCFCAELRKVAHVKQLRVQQDQKEASNKEWAQQSKHVTVCNETIKWFASPISYIRQNQDGVQIWYIYICTNTSQTAPLTKVRCLCNTVAVGFWRASIGWGRSWHHEKSVIKCVCQDDAC